jgi:hypothetical protein
MTLWIATRRRALNTRVFFTLLVVLALSAVLLSGPAGSAVPLERAGEGLCGIGSADFRDDGDLSGGDDDRWGDAEPWDGDPEDPGEDGTGGDDGDEENVEGTQAKPTPVTPLYRLRFLLSWVFAFATAR